MSVLSIILIVVVSLLGITDIRKKSVSLPALAGLLIFCIVWNLVTKEMGVAGMLFGAVPAIALYVICRLCRLNIGLGDILLTGIIGAALGADIACLTLLTASCGCAAVTGVLLVAKKISKDQNVAFIPFLGAGMVISGLLAG